MRKINIRLLVTTAFLISILILPVTSNGAISVEASETLRGIALNSPTHVYSSTSKSSNELKSYPQGSVLKYQTYNSDWYSAVVYINGKRQNGYIHTSDVETVSSQKSELKGISINNVKVYTLASTNSGYWKSFSTGSILKYRTFSSNWYEATVYVNGQRKTGYILKSDVENAVDNQVSLKGIALKQSTPVYKDASGTSEWKSYPAGAILKYQTFSSNWYEATVYVNGQRKAGYIKKADVENSVANQASLKGIALKSPTAIYKDATGTSTWKSYPVGSILKYQTFSSNWYEATVYVNGQRKTGYIKKADVENAIDESNQVNLSGIGINRPTVVYSAASTNSKQLKSYKAGTILKYQTFSSNWYQAKVYINGKPTIGYIHSNHVEELVDKHETLNGRALSKPTNVYAEPSTGANVLKTYPQDSNLKLRTLTKNWFEATVYVNGIKHTGYFNAKDVTTTDVTTVTSYSYDLDHMVSAQMKTNPPPQTDLTGGLGWKNASINQVQYYTNPLNFDIYSPESYQFLVLSRSVGLTKEDAAKINARYLSNAGILTGKAEVLIEGAQKHNINEIYLIAHAILETGNGKGSNLATGISKWTKRDSKGNIVLGKDGKPVIVDISPKKVYNMFGIGAIDKCAEDCGAQTAYENEWFDEDKAIKEGAAFSANKYINNGQNTLYKIRWNPEHLNKYNYASHQYATDVGWAVKQTRIIYNIYKLLERDFLLEFDVPQFVSQNSAPKGSTIWLGSTEEKTYPQGVYGFTDSGNMNLNLRPKPTTSGNDPIGSIPTGSKVEVLAETTGQVVNNNSTWYKVKFNGTTGWVHSSYVDLLNLLEVNASNLNVRVEPSTSAKSLGKVSNVLIAAALDNNNQIIRQNEWYKVYYDGQLAWISGGKDGIEFINVR